MGTLLDLKWGVGKDVEFAWEGFSAQGGYRSVNLKILFVLEHFLMLWHILRIFIKNCLAVVNKLLLQPGKSKLEIFLVFLGFLVKSCK